MDLNYKLCEFSCHLASPSKQISAQRQGFWEAVCVCYRCQM